MLKTDYNNALTRRILEIEGDDDDLTWNFVELDTAILKEPQP